MGAPALAAIEPHVPWSHRLKNGAPAGNPSLAPRCGARTHAGTGCHQPAMRNGRCRFHGGRSTGSRTEAGIDRIRAARTRHGMWGRESRDFRRCIAILEAQARLWIAIASARRRRPDIAHRRIERALARLATIVTPRRPSIGSATAAAASSAPAAGDPAAAGSRPAVAGPDSDPAAGRTASRAVAGRASCVSPSFPAETNDLAAGLPSPHYQVLTRHQSSAAMPPPSGRAQPPLLVHGNNRRIEPCARP